MHVYPKPLRPVMHRVSIVFGMLCSFIFSATQIAYAQPTPDATFIVVPATENYHQSENYKKFWGENYRKAWHTAVPFKIVSLDTLAGAVTPYALHTQQLSTTLLLRNSHQEEYVLRSFSKELSRIAPAEIAGTLLEDVTNDQISFSFPYAAWVSAVLANAAGIYHTEPQMVFVPRQKKIEPFLDSLASSLFLFEQNPIGNWESAARFGYSKNIILTNEMLANLKSNRSFQVNQSSFLRARLLDMLLGDWNRVAENWRWAGFEQEGQTIYEPIPINRDFALAKPEGFLPKLLIGMNGADHIQAFDYEIKKLPELNFFARELDQFLLNELSFDEWIHIATDLQRRWSDTVIVAAIQSLPLEIQKIYGASLAGKLKSRRDFLKLYAEKYYDFLSETVSVAGKYKDDFFSVSSGHKGMISLEIFEKQNPKVPYYFRFLNPTETKEIRLYGLAGEDSIEMKGKPGMRFRFIGGVDKDVYQLDSLETGLGKRIYIYDDYENTIRADKKNVRQKLSNDSNVHAFDYSHFQYNKKRLDKIVWYNNEDRFHVGLGYLSKKRHFRKKEWGILQESNLKYSISQKAFSAFHQTQINNITGKWNFHILAFYDQMKWINFQGLGNESILQTKNKSFYRVRSRNLKIEAGMQRPVFKQSEIGWNIGYQTLDILRDTAGYLSKQPIADDEQIFKLKKFLNSTFFYNYQNYNDLILPEKGLRWTNTITWQQNLKNQQHAIVNFRTAITKYSKLFGPWGLKNTLGAATIWGNPEFYQLNTLGADDNLRGFNRERFYGKKMFYAQNEIRFIKDVRSYYYNGKLGGFLLFDFGRVWVPHEDSQKFHSGYGLGLILSPFNMMSFEIAAARSADYPINLHVNVVKRF